MNTAQVEKEILGLEKKYWKAMGDSDTDAAVALTRFPCIVSGPMGIMRVEESEYRKMMDSNSQYADRYKNVNINDPKVELLNDKTALITYSIQMNSMKMIDVSTWIREGNQWKCAFHSENPEQKEAPLN